MKKEKIKKWFLMLLLSYVIIGVIYIITNKFDILSTVAWTVSYTLFYFWRNWKELQ